ncbi:uncharacterized protein LOC122529151 isoform X1 [Frieseomelitta varia]|uniref:uncharacterized protein LOC122529151 isoform X1 n=1 Tax=Frieseomelitta varia TaxID=561572 RepID=UPI001CB6AF88|nr:uncharacterized protein LOC122529151 isoform X1 [Frieseomelitta varia]XP_043510904.1 uncharacterized protein LOC122529151 isoform X1 [Frieseomelitta varia]
MYPCGKCQKVYSNASSLYRHLKLECGMPPQFHCPYCRFSSKRKFNLDSHVAHRHSKLLNNYEWLHCCRCYGRIASSSSSSSSSNSNNNSSNNNNSNNSKRARGGVLQRRAPQQQEAVSFWQADASAIRGTVTATTAETTMVVARVRLLAKWYFLTRSRYYRSLVTLVLCIWVYRTNNNESLGASFAGKVIDGKARCAGMKWLNAEASLQLFNAPCALTRPDSVAI